MAKTQYGFKKGSSTDAAILNLTNKIQKALQDGDHALGTFIDIEGCFDQIPHLTIKKALDNTKAKGMISDWIYYMVKNRYIELTVGDKNITRKTPNGCPQGGVLSVIY